MTQARSSAVVLLFVIAAGSVRAAGPATAPATAPAATKPSAVPEEAIKEIQSQFLAPDKEVNPAEMLALIVARMEKVLTLGEAAEKAYPDAANLARVRTLMLRAATLLSSQKTDEAFQRQLAGIAARLLASDAPLEEKVQADYIVTRSGVKPVDGSAAKVDPAKAIREFAERYAKTEVGGLAAMYAVLLADNMQQDKLKDELIEKLEGAYLEQASVRRFLRMDLNRHPDVGRPFEAELKRLDGTKLTLPKDLLGKVVVIDFWATWCPPCVELLPQTKKIYDKYKGKGVEIVGISQDEDKATLESFLKANDLGWIQTYGGGKDGDPTAGRYGIGAIPSLWVIDRNGKIVSDDAEANLEEQIEKALKVPASTPATGPASKPAESKRG